jgi:hypothetical protein
MDMKPFLSALSAIVIRRPLVIGVSLFSIAASAQDAQIISAPGAGITHPGDSVSNSTGHLWINTAGVIEYNRDHMFLDEMRNASYWWAWADNAHNTGDPALIAPVLDENGYPTSIPPELESIGVVLFVNQDPASAPSLAGRYRLTYDGEGTISPNCGIHNYATNITSGDGWLEFDYSPATAPYIDIRISETAGGGNHIRNVHLYRTDYEDEFLSGQVHHPAWADRFANVKVVRFMSAQIAVRGNDPDPYTWADRTTPEYFSSAPNGVAIEEIVALSNELGFDPWIHILHTADLDYTEQLATYVRDHLHPDRHIYWEWSNEIWNWNFPAATWINEQRIADPEWDIGGSGTGSWMQYGGMLAHPHMDKIGEVFAGQMDRITRVANLQLAWPAMGEEFLDAPWYVNELNGPAPRLSYDAVAITGYFGHEGLGMTVTEVQNELLNRFGEYTEEENFEWLEAICMDNITDWVQDYWTQYKAIAIARGLDMVMYEGGTHVVRIGFTGVPENDTALDNFFIAFNFSDHMTPLYEAIIAQWEALDVKGGFMQFHTIDNPGSWGSWGSLLHLDHSTAKYDVLMEYNNGTFP